MYVSDRRDCLRQMLAGLTVLSAGGFSLPMLGTQTEAKPRSGSHTGAQGFWSTLDRIKASALAHSLINAARAGVQAQRETNASKRAAILLGGGAGKEEMARAEKRYQTRTAELRKAKQALAEFTRTQGDSAETKFKQFVSKGGLKEALDHARRSAIQTLVKSDISPQEAQTAMKALDDRLAKVQGMASFKDVADELNRHLDELIAQKIAQEDPNPLCLFLL